MDYFNYSVDTFSFSSLEGSALEGIGWKTANFGMVGVATSFFKAELGAETFPIDESGSVYRGGSAFRPVVTRVGGAIKAARGTFEVAGVGAGVEGALSLGLTIGGGTKGCKRKRDHD